MPDPVPPPTLRRLLQHRELNLRLAGDEADLAPDALDAPVRWVHGSDLLDPTPFLADELVLLTTGTQFADTDGDDTYLAYVARLGARGVRGLGFGTEVVRDGIPLPLVVACRALRLPLFEVPYRTPFIAVARANAEAIAAQAYARRTWSLDAQRAISLAALRPDGLGATLAELARQFDTWVGLFDASGALAREHPAGAIDAGTLSSLARDVGAVLRRGTRAGSSLHVGSARFTLQTLGRAGRLRGVIAMAAGDLDAEARGVLTAVIAMAGLALEQSESLGRAHGHVRAGLVHLLADDDPALANRVARELWGGLPPAPVVVAVADGARARSGAAAEWLEVRAAESRGRVFFGRDDEGVVIVAAAGGEGILDEFTDLFEARLGVSEPAAYSAFSAALAQARTALRRGGGHAVSRFAAIAPAGVLSALDSEAARAFAHARLAPLRRSDERHGTALVATVRAWLEADARIDRAAEVLGIHRHTVRARIADAERLLGVDLSTFPGRAELWAALLAAG